MFTDKTKTSCNIDYDLQLEDRSKIIVLARDLLNDQLFHQKSYQCDIFKENECHHFANHDLELSSLESIKCNFCRFTDLLRDRHSYVNIIQSKSFNSISDKQYVSVRYRTLDQVESLEWCDFQPWRCSYACFAYACCSSKEDVLQALENYEDLKLKYKKTLISSKIFIEMTNNTDEELNKTMKLLNANPYNVSSLNIEDELKKSNFIIEKNLSSFAFNRNNSIFQFDMEVATEKSALNNPKLLNRNASIFQQVNSAGQPLNNQNGLLQQEINNKPIKNFDQMELTKKLKFNQSEITFFEFNPNECEADNVRKHDRISLVAQETLSLVFHKLLNMANRINVTEEKQLNYYSECLKSPVETNEESKSSSQALQPSSSFLSIKLFNRKIVTARILKYKADLYLTLNIIDLAFVNYAQAYAATKKENDTFWSVGSLEGLLTVSYLYLRDNLNSEKNLKGLKNTWKKKFSSQKDLNKLAIPFADFAENFTKIITSYNKNDITRFLALEVSFVTIKFFIQFNMRNEAISFMNYAVYISNLEMREESRIRRYYEISSLYDQLGMKRLSSFYRWISSSSIFRLMPNKSSPNQDNVYQNCLINRCVNNLIGNYELMKLSQQMKPASVESTDQYALKQGFPLAKKHMVLQTIEMFSYLNHFQETNKFSKYLLNELSAELTEKNFQFYRDVLTKIQPNEKYPSIKQYDAYKTNFYNLPKLNFFEIQCQEMYFNKIAKMKSVDLQTSKGIYIHRYENPLLSAKVKKVYNLRMNQLNEVDMIFINPTIIDLHVSSLDLILESHQDQKKFSVETYHYLEDETHSRSFVIPDKINDLKLKFSFKFDLFGKFDIIGYDINLWNNSSRILFKDLVQNDSKNFNKNRNNISKSSSSLIQPTYEVEFFPHIPVIKEIEFHLEDSNQNLTYINSLTECISAALTCKLGINQRFKLNLKSEEEIDIYQASCTINNEYNLRNVSISISAEIVQGNCYLTVDSSDNNLDMLIDDQTGLEVNCMLEVRYTNKLGRELNLNHTSKKQIVVKLEQIVYATIYDIVEIDSNHFQLELMIKNLQNEPIYIESYDGTDEKALTQLAEKTSTKLRLKLEKLDIFPNLNKDNLENILLETFNENLENRIYFERVDDQSKLKRASIGLKFADKNIFLSRRSLIVKCPIDISCQLKATSKLESSGQLHSLVIIIKNPAGVAEFLRDYVFSIEVGDKLKNKLVDAKKFFIKELLLNEFCLREYNIILKQGEDEEQNKLNFRLKLTENTKSTHVLEWKFVTKLNAGTFEYYLN